MRPKTTTSPRAEPTVVFHDRQVMEEAVHALVDAGVSPRHIRVDHAVVDQGQVEPAPERGRALVPGLALGAIVGGTLAVLWMLGLRAAGLVAVPLPWIVLRVLGGMASGAVLGALLALVLDALVRGARTPATAPTGDFLVRVKAPDELAAAKVRRFLLSHGGAPVPA